MSPYRKPALVHPDTYRKAERLIRGDILTKVRDAISDIYAQTGVQPERVMVNPKDLEQACKRVFGRIGVFGGYEKVRIYGAGGAVHVVPSETVAPGEVEVEAVMVNKHPGYIGTVKLE